MSSLILGYLFIFFARIMDMSLDTLRVILIVKGKRAIGALLGFVEVLIWLSVIRIIFADPNNMNIGNMIAYATGFAAGNYIGGFLEELIAIGKVSVQVVLNRCDDETTNRIRESGFAVSSIECKGKFGLKTLLIMQVQRKHMKKLCIVLNEIDPGAFITVLDTAKTINGYFDVGRKKL